MRLEWGMAIEKTDQVDAMGHAQTRATLRRNGGGFEPGLTFTACAEGLSIRSSAAAMAIPADLVFPDYGDGPALRRLPPKLTGPQVTLR